MRVVIQDNYEKMCLWAANYIANRIKAHNAGPEKDRPFVLGLPTGSSPIGVYKGTSCTTISLITWWT